MTELDFIWYTFETRYSDNNKNLFVLLNILQKIFSNTPKNTRLRKRLKQK